jgi:16S rRNA (uracil1498-N3)-methyltransferase
MHRFFIAPGESQGRTLALTGREAHHAIHVLRLRTGDRIQLLNGQGQTFDCQIAELAKDRVGLAVLDARSAPAPPFRITLAQAIPKGKLFEEIVQKATELGAFQIVPLITERVVGKFDSRDREHKLEKWRLVAVEAIKQCGSPWLPRIEPPCTIQQFLSFQSTIELPLLGSLGEKRRHPRACFQEFSRQHGKLPATVSVAIGPEGDFTPGERVELESAGALPITLGPLVLRTDTAAMYCLSMINYELQAAG